MKDALNMGWNERTVTVDRVKLLETLKSNREKHRSEYEQSVTGYRRAAQAALKKHLAKATNAIADSAAMITTKIERFDPDDPPSDQVVVLGQISFKLRVPEDHTRSYDVAIQMAEWEVAETIELTQSQFQCFVMDDWDWKKDFEFLNKSYSIRA